MNITETTQEGQSPTTPNLDYARQLLGEKHVNHCLQMGENYVSRLYQGAWFVNLTLEPCNHCRAYLDILDYLRAGGKPCQS